MKIKYILFTTALILISFAANSQTTENIPLKQPKGEFTEINVERDKEINGLLNSQEPLVVKQAIETVIKDPNLYVPPVLYLLSHNLFLEGRKDEAIYYYYIAQLRARYDSNLCLDESAKQQVGVLNRMFPEINEYAMTDIKKLEKTVKNVIAFVSNNNENYDHRWLNLYGMGAVIKSLDDNAVVEQMSKPKSEWPTIKQKTISNYQDGFKKYVLKK